MAPEEVELLVIVASVVEDAEANAAPPLAGLVDAAADEALLLATLVALVALVEAPPLMSLAPRMPDEWTGAPTACFM